MGNMCGTTDNNPGQNSQGAKAIQFRSGDP
jgi:hypothetical protein